MNRENKLRPCPFCGNKYMRIMVGTKVGEKHHMVACDKCSAVIAFEEATTYLMCEKFWNRRVD